MTPSREDRLREMTERRCQSQMEAAKAAGLGVDDEIILMLILDRFITISCAAIRSVPLHLQDLMMRMFLDEQETVVAAQERYESVSPENKPRIDEIASASVRHQGEMLDREAVAGEERNRVTAAMFMLNVWMMGAHSNMPASIDPLFSRLAMEQFRELVEIYGMERN